MGSTFHTKRMTVTRAAIYSRVDTTDRAAMPARKAAAESFCQSHGWSFVHYTDSASGSRPPLQFVTGNQTIRPGLTRLLSAVENGSVTVIVPGDDDALSTSDTLSEKLMAFLQQHGFSRQENDGDPSFYFLKA